MFPSRRITLGGGDVFRDEYSLEFDNTNDYVNLGNVVNLGSTTDFTITCWAKSSDWTNEYIIAKWEDANNRWGMGTDAFDRLAFNSMGSSSAGIEYTGGTLTSYENKWVHLTIVADRSTDTRGYINGVLDDTDTGTDPDLDLDNTGNLSIGFNDQGDRYFGGKISEVAIWNTALSAGSVSNIYNNGVPTDLLADSNSANLQGWWRMGDGTEGASGTTIYDMSANTNNGTMTNMDAGTDYVTDVP